VCGRCRCAVRLLRALASMGVTEETTPEHFRLTDFGRPLQKDAPQSVWPAVVFLADLLADSWSLLTDCVRTENRPLRSGIRKYLPGGRRIRKRILFSRGDGYGSGRRLRADRCGMDFSRAKVVADLGVAADRSFLRCWGSTRICAACWSISMQCGAARARFAKEAASSRCELIAADLTQSVPAGADVYMIKHVLHGVGTRCQSRFSGTALVIPQDGRLLIIEFILPPLVSHADPQLEGRL